jgi:outer membrane protein assembly factor BamC
MAGCSSIEGALSSSKVDYRTSARQTKGLDIPPDLTQLARDGRAQVQGGVVSASSMQQTAVAAPAAVKLDSEVALAKVGELSIERDGDTRWLRTSLSPEQLWPQLRGFWDDLGLKLVLDQPQLGVMETDWSENRAKVEAGGLRKYLGSFADGLFSSGERDMYRTRVERTAKGTLVYITHKGLMEVPTSATKDTFRWAARPADSQLEATMLSRLLLKLGGKAEAAELKPAATAQKPATTIPSSSIGQAHALSNVPDSIQVKDGFDRAWRRVGQSLDRNGFTIEDRDRVQGLYFLRYADPTKAGKEEPGFFAKLFGAKTDVSLGRYRVSVKSQGEISTVQILDDKSVVQTDDIAKRIISLMMDDLK